MSAWRFSVLRLPEHRLGQAQPGVHELAADDRSGVCVGRQIASPLKLLDQPFVAQPPQRRGRRNTARFEGAGNPRLPQHQTGRKAAVEQMFAQDGVDDFIERPRAGM